MLCYVMLCYVMLADELARARNTINLLHLVTIIPATITIITTDATAVTGEATAAAAGLL